MRFGLIWVGLLWAALAARADRSAAPPVPVRVMLVPHSHEDPGWTQTIDEYYNGYDTAHYGVKRIYDSVLSALASHPHRKFIPVEIVFLSRWWQDRNTTDASRELFRRLLDNGQLELVNGGWVMQDEIASHWAADVNQMTLGHRWVVDTFGPQHLPETAWHIDPQGHLGATAAMFAQMGLRHFVIARIPLSVKQEMERARRLTFVWQGMTAGNEKRPILTRLLDEYGYCPPNEPRNLYFWDDYSYWRTVPGGAPAMNAGSVPRFATRMAGFVRQRAAWVERPADPQSPAVLLFPWGCDFEFQNATAMFENMDVVISYVNQHSAALGFTAEYATLADYFGATKNRSGGARTPEEHANFAPYAIYPGTPPLDLDVVGSPKPPRSRTVNSNGNSTVISTSPGPGRAAAAAASPTMPTQSWWSGEFTSWPLMKKLTRQGAAALRVAETLNAVTVQRQSSAQRVRNAALLDELRKASAEAQHHDAVDGTSPARVTATWERHLTAGSAAATMVSELGADILLDDTDRKVPFTTDAAALSTGLLRAEPVEVAFYNPLGWPVSRAVSLRVPCPATVIGADGVTELASDLLVETWRADHWPGVSPAPGNGTGGATPTPAPPALELVFVVDLPPMGFARCTVVPTAGRAITPRTPVSVTQSDMHAWATTLSNGAGIVVGFEGGELRRIENRAGGLVLNVTTPDSVAVYPATTSGDLASNNYKFCPADFASAVPGVAEVTVVVGAVVQELQVRYRDGGGGGGGGWAQQRYRLFRGVNATSGRLGDAVEVSISVGQLPVDAEVVWRVVAEMDHRGQYWSDEAGWFSRQRTFDAHKQADPLLNIAANYVPLCSAGFVRDTAALHAPHGGAGTRQLTLVTHHSHGFSGGSANASLEVMLHRRLSNGWLDDNSTVTSDFLLALDSPGHAAQQTRAHTLQNPPVPMFRAANSSPNAAATEMGGSGEGRGAATGTGKDTGSGKSNAGATSMVNPGCAASSSTLNLPYGTHLLSFDVWNASLAGGSAEFTLLVRLANLLEHGEAGDAGPAAVYLEAGLFRALVPCSRLLAIQETSLAATPLHTTAAMHMLESSLLRPDTATELRPLDVRTFLASFRP